VRPARTTGGAPLLSLTRTGVEVLLADMAERDRWLADALGTLSETEVEVLRLAGLLMDRLADLDLPAVDR
jgi:hypothetical protein